MFSLQKTMSPCWDSTSTNPAKVFIYRTDFKKSPSLRRDGLMSYLRHSQMVGDVLAAVDDVALLGQHQHEHVQGIHIGQLCRNLQAKKRGSNVIPETLPDGLRCSRCRRRCRLAGTAPARNRPRPSYRTALKKSPS
ncbi:hypothetical protein O0L34_g10910 [Tuta absoluta]|nr:hypothetical protein O0L34_g10910 [Tuta absoluta]